MSSSIVPTSPPTTTPPTDPYSESRRGPADGSIRYALSEIECREARRRVANIKSVQDLIWYEKKYVGCLSTFPSNNDDNRYYSQALREYKLTADRLKEANETLDCLLPILDCIEKEVEKAEDLTWRLAEDKTQRSRLLTSHLPEIRSAITQQALRHRQQDEQYLLEENRKQGIFPIIRHPFDHPNPAVRAFSDKEREDRIFAGCDRCKIVGHFETDHIDVVCPHCQKYAPGHLAIFCGKKPAPVPVSKGKETWRGDTEEWGCPQRNAWGTWNEKDIPKETWEEYKKKICPPELSPDPILLTPAPSKPSPSPDPPMPQYRPGSAPLTVKKLFYASNQRPPTPPTASSTQAAYLKKTEERCAAKGRKPWAKIQEEQAVLDKGGRKALNAERNKKTMEMKGRGRGRGGGSIRGRPASYRVHEVPMKTKDAGENSDDDWMYGEYDPGWNSDAEHNLAT
ncbi:hypothetical protein H1R20_g15776, partial [Candolleomyces eurysporus]